MFALCCHSNATHAPIANPPNSAQLGGIPTTPQVTSGSVQYCGMRPQTDRQTDEHDHNTFCHLQLMRNATNTSPRWTESGKKWTEEQIHKCNMKTNFTSVDCVKQITLPHLTLPLGWTAWKADCSALRPFWCWPSVHPRCEQGYYNLNEALANRNRLDGDILHSSSSCSV